MAGNEDKPRLPQRRGRKAQGELPDGFEPIVPLFRRSGTPAPRLPRGAVAPTRPATPDRTLPAREFSPAIADPAPPAPARARSRVLVSVLAALVVAVIVAALVIWVLA